MENLKLDRYMEKEEYNKEDLNSNNRIYLKRLYRKDIR